MTSDSESGYRAGDASPASLTEREWTMIVYRVECHHAQAICATLEAAKAWALQCEPEARFIPYGAGSLASWKIGVPERFTAVGRIEEVMVITATSY